MSGAEPRDVRQYRSEEALDMSTKTYVDSPVSGGQSRAS